MVLWMLLLSCIRPSDVYDVTLSGAGTDLDAIEPAPTTMGGRIELARYRLWGTNIGHGVTGLFGDMPRMDGTDFVVGGAEFGYPATTGFDKRSAFLSPGPTLTDRCFTRLSPGASQGFSEYVDVGDHVALSTTGQVQVTLARDPASHPRPAGESWYVGYGAELIPALTDHPELPDTWQPGATWQIGFPGTVAPREATFGAVPYPLSGATMRLPPEISGVMVDGAEVRPPHHGYNAQGVWKGVGRTDDVRFEGPWKAPMALDWTPSSAGGPVTVAIRLHGSAPEGSCSCSADCGAGFGCEDGECMGNDGSTGLVLGELVCTLSDDGSHTIRPGDLSELMTWVDQREVAGATLWIARINEGTAFIPDVLTWNGKRIGINPIRVRSTDLIVTRLEAP